jgi:ADP-ribose pyrophosphatase
MHQKTQQLEEKTIASTPIFSGRVISLQVDEVLLPNGKTASREIVKHPGAVAIMAVHEDKLLVVAQYRKALEKVQVEIPAGKLEKGEDWREAAARELEEETGYVAQSLTHVCSFYTSPGFADEILHLYFTNEIVPGTRNPDEDEFVEAEFITIEQAREYIAKGFISDAKTMLTVFAWQTYRLTGSFQ